MLEFEKIVFVTDTDESTGPLAAALAEHYLPLEKVDIDSRGLMVTFPAPMNPKTVAVASSKGIEIDHETTQISDEDFGQDTLVLVLDETKKQRIYDDFEKAANVYTLTEYIDEAGSITNPDGGDLSDYAQMYDLLDETIKKLTDKLKSYKFKND
ncbi:MAG: hypothetical protein IJF94_02330 [Eubacterium sp.]|nr:hypothetical protein [Eubacterium sp.]